MENTVNEIRTCQGIPFSGTIVQGEYGGSCYICVKADAIYYNHITKKYVCPKCAETLNKEDGTESVKLGHDLCTAPEWLVSFANESGQFCECYIKAYDNERVERAWVDGEYEGYRTLSGDNETFWDETCDEENILSMERTGYDKWLLVNTY